MTLYSIDILKRMRCCGTPSTSVTRLVSNSTKMDKLEEKLQLLSNQRGFVIWLTSLYTHDRIEVSNSLENHLSKIKVYSLVLDDISNQFGNVGNLANFLASNGIVTIINLSAPLRKDRAWCKQIIGNKMIEVHLENSVDFHYNTMFTSSKKHSIDDFSKTTPEFEIPFTPDLTLNIKEFSYDKIALQILFYLQNHNYIN